MSKTRVIIKSGAAVAAAAALILGGTSAAAAHDGAGKSGGRGSALTELVTAGTLTQTQVNAVKDALQEQRSADKEANKARHAAERDAVLSDLVANGTLTQAQADAIKAADRRGMRELVENGTLDRADLQAVRQALRANHDDADRTAKKAERDAARDAVLSGLVSDGTLTQSQADAVATAIESHQGEKSGKRGKRGNRGGGGMRGASA